MTDSFQAPSPLQAQAASFASEIWDAIVIGAGPAGAVAAIHLAGRGRRVLLLDRQAFPRDKVCGDVLIADALGCLREAGLEEEVRAAGHPVASLSIFSASQVEFPIPGDYLALRRRELDALLVARAAAAGAVFARGEAARLECGMEKCVPSIRVLLLDGPVLCGRTAVLASGADVRLLEPLGLAAPPEVSGFAMRCYLRSELPLDHLIVSFDRAVEPGYGWIFPLGGGEFNVGCGVIRQGGVSRRLNLREAFLRLAENFPPLRELLRQGEVHSPLRGARLRCGLGGARAVAGGLLVAGDALGSTLPFTGEGIGKAMQTGRAAALAIDVALACGDLRRLSAYQDYIEGRLSPLYADYCRAQRWFVRSWVNDLVARRVRGSPFLQRAFAGLMDESVSPSAIFSLRGLLKSFVA